MYVPLLSGNMFSLMKVGRGSSFVPILTSGSSSRVACRPSSNLDVPFCEGME